MKINNISSTSNNTKNDRRDTPRAIESTGRLSREILPLNACGRRLRLQEAINQRTQTREQVLQRWRNPTQPAGNGGALRLTGISVPTPESMSQEEQKVQEGARFIIDQVLPGASNKILENFKILYSDPNEPDIASSILVKAIAINVFGSNEIPDFFEQDTKAVILALRQALNQPKMEAIVEELKNVTSNLAQFNVTLLSEDARPSFNRLMEAASNELQGLFFKKCWPRAIQMLKESAQA